MKRILFLNLKKFFTLIITILLFLILFPKIINAQPVVDCPYYCPLTYPDNPLGVCSRSDPDPGNCISASMLCQSNPTEVCYCCSSAATPTPTPCMPPWQSCDFSHPCCPNPPGYVCSGGYCVPYSTPSPTSPPVPTNTITPTPSCSRIYPQCTGLDGDNPCQRYGHDTCTCQQNGGRWIDRAPFCYPPTCRCGHSTDDCPYNLPDYAWTCKTGSPGFTCSQEDEDRNAVDCSPGNINCKLGHGQVPCDEADDSCSSECGNDWSYCESGICYEPTTCGSIPGGPGGCVEPQYCAPEDVWPIPDACAPPYICCSAPGCIGIFSGTRGSCYFMGCPPDTFFEGINPPYPETGCPLLNYCCTKPGDDWISRNTLNPQCTINGQSGIKTAIGCISVTSQNDLLKFTLPWAIGVAGGSAFILIIVAGFLIITSGGDPQKAKAGKELLGASVAGLLLIIFSVYILDIIGIRIFRLPGLT